MKKKTNPFRYAIGLFALTFLTQLFHGFSYSYFVEETGLITVALAATAKIVFVVVDGVNDIFFAALSEKTRTRWGKRLPWLVGCLPWLAISIVFTFIASPQWNISLGQFFAYYLIISIIFENFSTIMYINYGSLFPVLFKTNKERNTVSTLRHTGEIIGMALCLVLTPIIVDQIGYVKTAMIYGVIYVIIMGICVTGIRYDPKEDTRVRQKYSFKKTLKDVINNPSFILYNIAVSFTQACLGVLVTIYPIYAKYVLNVNALEQGILMAVLFGTVILSLVIWYKALNRFGHRKCWKATYLMFPFIIGSLALPNNFVTGLIVVIFIGPFVGGLFITPDLMSAELIDIDRRKHGMRREASFISFGTVMQRISVALSAILMTLISMMFGYESGKNPGPNPALAFRVLTGIMMPLLAGIGAVFAVLYIRRSKKDLEYLVYRETMEISRDEIKKLINEDISDNK